MSPFDLKRAGVTANPGVLIGAAFGAVFVVANSGAPVPAGAGGAIKGAGVVAVLAVLWAQARTRRASTGEVVAHRPGFGRAFWLVVAGEVVIGAAGLVGLRLAGAPQQVNVAWIAVVVGAHFVALAVVWRDIGISTVGAVMAMAGLAGLAMAAAGTADVWIPTISGVVSGFALLTGSLAASVSTRGGAQYSNASTSSQHRPDRTSHHAETVNHASQATPRRPSRQ